MKYQLINKPDSGIPCRAQIAINRGVDPDQLSAYFHCGRQFLNEPEQFGEENLKRAAACLIKHIQTDDDAIVIVDCDCDGYTSSAVLINYLDDLFPAWVNNHLTWYMHTAKQHGLEDNYHDILESTNKLVLAPDSSSNDYRQHKKLEEAGIDVIIFDHHEADHISENAITINNQLSDYPNKELSGVGVTWQFCRYLDKLMNTDYADEYIDLVALGNCGDMMSMLSLETKYLIDEGFKPENIKNPFIFNMWQKNEFKLGNHITPMGAAFYIVPFVNAITRSGTQEEKEIIFKSMLRKEAFKDILSDKRGHKAGELEQLVTKAMRVCTNVKNRQTKAQDAGMALLESKIENENLLAHKVLLFDLEKGEIEPTIRGLVANKIMAKYQRPCCVVTHTDGAYQGSARGYDKSGITNFKDICEDAPGCMFAQGHQGAFGIGIELDKKEEFLEATDLSLKEMSSEAKYMVDYIFHNDDGLNHEEIVLDIASMDSYWGKDFDTPLICVEKLEITKDNIKMMASNTVKITTPYNMDIVCFRMPDAEYENLLSQTGSVTINAICEANKNEWQGNIAPQLFLKDYEIVNKVGWVF